VRAVKAMERNWRDGRRSGDDPIDPYWVGDSPSALLDPQLCGLVRCVFAPSRVGELPPLWRTADVGGLAPAAEASLLSGRASLDPGHLAVLADALEDAGCTDAGLLGHLRGPGPHALGCWALDAVLGRE